MSRSTSRARGRTAARAVAERFALRRPAEIRLEALAWTLGAEVVEGELTGAAARLVRVGKRARIRLSDRIAQPEIRRFSIAHELGHFVLNHASRGVSLCHEIDVGTPFRDSELEAEANGFAAELLMPAEMVAVIVAGRAASLELATELSTVFRTSLPASAIRIIELASERCAAVYAEHGEIQWASRSAACDWPLARTGQLPFGSAAHRCLDERLATCRRANAGSAWGVNGEGVLEEAVVIDARQAVLTVLSQPEVALARLTRPFESA